MKKQTINKLLRLNRNLYNHQSQQWSKTRKRIWELEIIDFIKSIKESSSVLDIGCGNARLYQKLKDKSIKYTGIDFSKSLIKTNKLKYPKADFKIIDALKIDYNDQFNYIISIAVLHHIPSNKLQLQFINNCFHALRNGGILFLSVWNRWQDKYKYFLTKQKPYPDMKKADLIVPWKKTKDVRYIHAFTKSKLEKLLKTSLFDKYKVYYSAHGKIICKNKALNIFIKAQK